MTGNTDTRKKANAVFFSIIMVLSMAAAGFAAAPAAAIQDDGDIEIDEVIIDDDTENANANYTVNASIVANDSGVSDADVEFVSVDIGDDGFGTDELDGVDVTVNGDSIIDNPDTEDDIVNNTNDGSLVIEFSNETDQLNETDDFNVSINNVENGNAGTYNLTVGLHEGDEENEEGGFNQTSVVSDTLEFEINEEPTGSFSGTITSAIDGEPVNDTEFEFTDADGDAFNETNTTDADGNYTVSDVPVGTYNVTASANPSGTITGVEVNENETTENQDIEVVDAELNFEDQTYATSTDFVNVDTANLEGENETLFTVDLHPTDGDNNIIAEEIIGTSEVLTGDNENVTVDLAEGEEITETDDYVAMIHVVDDEDVEVGDDAAPGQFPALTVNDDFVVDQATVTIEDELDNLAIVRGNVEDRQGIALNGIEVQLVNNDTGLVEDTFITREIDGNDGEFILEGVPEADGTDYNLVVDDPDFRTFTRTIEGLEPGDRVDQSITLERIVTADELDVIEPDDPHTVDIEDEFDATVEVQTEDLGEGLEALADEDVTAENVSAEFDNPNDAGASLEIIPGTETTDDDGQATFTIGLKLDGDADEYDEDITAQVEFTADSNPDASDTLDITFEAEPPIGDGFVNGEVREIVDTGAEASPDNVEDAPATNVHAVRLDRFQDNAVSSDGFEAFDATENSDLNVSDDEEETARVVVANTTTDEVVEVLNVQTDYLLFGEDQAVSQNLSVAESGFDIIGDTDGSYAVAVLEPSSELGDDESYAVEIDGELVTFDAANDITYDGTDERYTDVTNGYTDVSDMDGEFGLQDLFTQDEVGLDHVVIAGDGNPGVGFANGQAYDIVEVFPANNASSDQFGAALNVEAVDIQADSVNITNVGTHPPLADTGGAPDFDEVEVFENQSAEFRQEIPRDGETIDVINLETFVEEDGTTLGDEVTVSYDVDIGDEFNGEFANLSIGGEVLEVGPDGESITVDTSVVDEEAGDGEAFVFLVTDDAGLGDDADVTINVEMENAGDEAFTDKTFFGTLDQEYQSGSITGVVTDDNDNPVDARIFVSELVDDDTGVTITFEPDDVEDLENFTATVLDENGDVVETVNLTADDMRNFEFQGFDSQLELAEGEDEFELLADRAADRTTLSPVPAVAADPGVSLSLTGVSQTGETGESVSTDIEVDRTSTASIVIEGVDDAFFNVDNLDPEDATIMQGDDLTVTADVDNFGDLAGEQEIVLEVENEAGDVVFDDSQELTLDAGAGDTVEFTVEDVQLDAGDYTHSVSSEDDSAEGTLTIEEADDGNENNSSPLSEYTNEDGVVDSDGLQNAFADWQAGQIDSDTLQDAFAAWQSGNPVE